MMLLIRLAVTIARRLGLEVENLLRRAQHRAGLREVGEGVDDGAGLLGQSGRRSERATAAQRPEHVRRAHRLVDQLVLVRVEEMSHEAGVLVHDVVPEGGHLTPVELRLACAELFEAPGPPLGLVAEVVEEQGPHEAVQPSLLLSGAHGRLVVDERLDLLDDLGGEAAEVAFLQWPRGVDALVESGEGLREAKACARSASASSGGMSTPRK